MNFGLRNLLRSLTIRYRPTKTGNARVFTDREGYPSLVKFRELEANGFLRIESVADETTPNMRYKMSRVHFTILKGL